MAVAATKMGGSTRADMGRPPKPPDSDTYLGRVSLRLKALREATGMEPAQAAKAITKAGYEVTESTVYRWEQGKTHPHLEAIPAISIAYGVTPRTVLPPG